MMMMMMIEHSQTKHLHHRQQDDWLVCDDYRCDLDSLLQNLPLIPNLITKEKVTIKQPISPHRELLPNPKSFLSVSSFVM
jgi:hypothetical protein